MTIRDALKNESDSITLMILHSCDGFCKYWLDPDCLIYTGREEIDHIENEVLDLPVVQYYADRMFDGTLLIIWI